MKVWLNLDASLTLREVFKVLDLKDDKGERLRSGKLN